MKYAVLRGRVRCYSGDEMILLALLFALRLTPSAPDQPLKQPQIAVSGDRVALTYGGGDSIYFARSDDHGKTFSTPVKVTNAKVFALGSHRGPRIAFSGDAIVITAITATVRFKEGNLTSWRSDDGGKTWSDGARVSDVPNAALEGLHGMAAGPNGLVWVVWLDLRDKAMKLFGAVSKDSGKTWLPNHQIYASPDGHICECCHPTAYVGPKGELYAMWRNWLSGSRDMYVASSTDGKSWNTRKLGQGTWPLQACPMDGGGLAFDGKGTMHTAWRRDGAIYITTSSGQELEIGKGKNPAITATSAGPIVAWQDGASILLKKPGAAAVNLGPGKFPTLSADKERAYIAWEHEGAISVEEVR